MESFLSVLRPYKDLIGENHALWRAGHLGKDFLYGNIQKAADLFIKKIDELEKLPVVLMNTQFLIAENIDYSQWIKAVAAALDHLKNHKGSSQVVERLAWRLEGLRYRITAKHGGVDCVVNDGKIEESDLYKDFVEWKNQPEQLFNLDKSYVTKKEKKKLGKLLSYAAFSEEVLKNKELQEKIFHWMSRLKGDIDLFIEFPCLTEKMISCRVQDWVGYIDNKIIKVDKKSGNKTVLLKYIGKDGITKTTSILDKKTVITLEKSLEVTVKEFFSTMQKKKEVEQGLLTLTHDGLKSWDSHALALVDKDRQTRHPIDVNQENWLEELPIVKKISEKKAKKKYGEDLGEKGQEYANSLCASSEHPEVRVEGTHGFVEYVLPLKGEEKGKAYALYHFGLVADKYPVGASELYKMIFKFMPGAINCFEENPVYKKRRITWITTLIDSQALKISTGCLAGSIEKARKGVLPFQPFSEPCSLWALQIYNVGRKAMAFQELSPEDTFKIHLTKTVTTGIVKVSLLPTKILSEKAANRWMRFIFNLGGPWRKTEFNDGEKIEIKSCSSHLSWKDMYVYPPSMLHKKQEDLYSKQEVQQKLEEIEELYKKLDIEIGLQQRKELLEELKKLLEEMKQLDPLAILPRGRLRPIFLTHKKDF